MTSEEVKRLFDTHGACLQGHFLLSSGYHSDTYLQTALLLQHPPVAQQVGSALASAFPEPVDVIVAPALGGVVIGFAVAQAKGCRSVFAEREAGKMALRRGFAVHSGERALVVEDVVTTGGSTREVVALVQANQAKVVGVGVVVDRSTSELRFSVPFVSLWRWPLQTTPPERCEGCRRGLPLMKPGSRG
ncbi:MAG: orotate phosphoribosyltransferase [Elusimicrobia bacterium]|nr:orotate phosphoribosyltransferase [Elusimicrobiota bacterium]